MGKPLSLFIIAGLMAGCASEPEADEVQAAPHVLQVSCYQADWQAETVPIIYSRGGPGALDKYEFMPPVVKAGCP
jgi:hypothetical protein